MGRPEATGPNAIDPYRPRLLIRLLRRYDPVGAHLAFDIRSDRSWARACTFVVAEPRMLLYADIRRIYKREALALIARQLRANGWHRVWEIGHVDH